MLSLSNVTVLHLKFFEWTFGLAVNYFAEENVDIAVIETGLGGRLDSTNIIKPELSVITNIGKDHTNLLGDTLQKIATEKAGIIKPEIPVVVGELQPELVNIFIEKAQSTNSPIYFANKHFCVLQAEVVYNSHPRLLLKIQCINGSNLKHILENDHIVQSQLPGYYQVKNIPTTLMAVDILNTRGFKITEENVKKGLSNVITNTELLGRWQKLADDPMIICDTGHNIDGIGEIIRQISFTPHDKLHIVLGFVNDKDIDSILKLLPADAAYYFCKASIPRALDEKILIEKAKRNNLIGCSFSTVAEALKAAKMNAKTDDLIFVGGSTFVVAEVL